MSRTRGRRVAVLGIGSVVRGDDGVGPRLVQRLRERYRIPDWVRVEDLGTPGRDLLYELEDADAAIVVDAVRTHEPPGRVHRYDRSALSAPDPDALTLAHDPTLLESLLTADLMGTAPRDVVLLGITIESAAAGTELSPPVREAMGALETAVLQELERFGVRLGRREEPVAGTR